MAYNNILVNSFAEFSLYIRVRTYITMNGFPLFRRGFAYTSKKRFEFFIFENIFRFIFREAVRFILEFVGKK